MKIVIHLEWKSNNTDCQSQRRCIIKQEYLPTCATPIFLESLLGCDVASGDIIKACLRLEVVSKCFHAGISCFVVDEKWLDTILPLARRVWGGNCRAGWGDFRARLGKISRWKRACFSCKQTNRSLLRGTDVCAHFQRACPV